MIKIFHTADIHMGMKFRNYPEPVKSYLQEARADVLDNMIKLANEEKCNLFIIAGDLFDKITGIDKKTIGRATAALNNFQGECVLVMPGNHDYDNGMIELWDNFLKNVSNKIVFINEEWTYSLEDYGLNAVVYPAPCHAKHSSTNKLQWIKETKTDNNYINIGIAHGALEGLSPDLENSYYNMSIKELQSIPMDLWLLGHTHITYPFKSPIANEKIFNPGTPEPDGLDCKHNGQAWIITIDENRKTNAELVQTGTYKFTDRVYAIEDKDDLDRILDELKKDEPEKTIARITLNGSVDEDVFEYRQEIYSSIEKNIIYLIVEDSDFKMKITKEKIHREFSDGSFPQEFLLSLSDDEDTLQLAYELIMEVRNNDN
jgi:DNA repair exonuclease SbcCD nuclease subunit